MVLRKCWTNLLKNPSVHFSSSKCSFGEAIKQWWLRSYIQVNHKNVLLDRIEFLLVLPPCPNSYDLVSILSFPPSMELNYELHDNYQNNYFAFAYFIVAFLSTAAWNSLELSQA